MLHLLLVMPSNETLRWVLVAIAGATILYTIFRPSMRKKDPLSRPSGGRLSQQRNVERQMESLLVELSEMSRQITAQLDTRSQKLEMLIQEADEKIAELERAKCGETPEPRMTPAEREAWTVKPDPAPVHIAAAPSIQVDPRHQEIYDLADNGAAAPDIARQLNRPRNEVELILALRSHG